MGLTPSAGDPEDGPAPASTAAAREREILRFLRERKEDDEPHATAADIFNRVSPTLGDSRTIQAYYKTLDRLEASGTVISVQDASRGSKRYALADGIALSHSFTLDDIREAILNRKPAAIIAAAERHDAYLSARRETVLRRAGQELLEEADPAKLVLEMICEDVRLFQARLAEYGTAKDPTLWATIAHDYNQLQRLYQRELSLSHHSLTLPLLESLEDASGSVHFDKAAAESEIRHRILGDACLSIAQGVGENDVTVAGSDATVRFSQLRFLKAPAFQDEDGGLVSVNSSLAVERLSSEVAQSKGRPELIHSLPLTREAVDDPKNRGMIMLRLAYEDLTDSEFEHAKKSATDVVQWRVDSAVFTGVAPDIATSEIMPRPLLHIRDGTVVPQEREHKHYIRKDAYGEFTREALRHTRHVVQSIRDSKSTRVFAGAVKSTQSRFFGSFINWYISSGSRLRLGSPIDPDWQLARTSLLPDHIFMTHFFSALPTLDRDRFYTTFIVLRNFASATEYFASTRHVQKAGGWSSFIEQERRRRKQAREASGQPPEWSEGIPVEDDDFVYACENVEYASFYLGTTAGHPAPLVPRYEFILPTHPTLDQKTKFALACHSRIVQTLTQIGFLPDRDHNFLTDRTLFRILPAVVQHAHEMSKAFGGMLERVLHGAVVELLSRTRRRRLTRENLRFEPADPEEIIRGLLQGEDVEPDPED